MAIDPITYTGGTTSLVRLTGNALIDSLIVGSKWGVEAAGNGAALTFSFPATLAAFDTAANVPGNYNASEVTQSGFANYLNGYSPFVAAAQVAAREVLQSFANVAKLTFTEVVADTVNAGVLRFANAAPPGLGATTYGVSSFPQDFAGAGDTWMNSAFSFPEGWAAGTQNFLTLLHEAGHAVGLKHPHDAGMGGNAGWPAPSSILPFTGTDTLTNESTQTMVMAYNDIPALGSVDDKALQSDFAPTTPMRYDIAALQYLYGANLAFNAGDTVYTFDGAVRYNQTLWDGGGVDTIVATGSRNVFINLASASWSALGQPITFSTRNGDLSLATLQPQLNDVATVFIYDTVVIENATGGGGNDTLKGNAVANRLQGGGGDDNLDGAGGVDAAVYASARSAMTVTKTATGWTVAGGSDGSDNLANIERLIFADKGLALDTAVDGAGGQAAQILRGLFGASSLQNTTFVGIALGLLDQGMSYSNLVGLAIGTSIFEQLAGSRSNTDFVKLVYKNVIGVEAGQADLDTYVGLLDSGAFTQTALGVLALQVSFNTGSVELVGLAATGIEFMPQG